MNPIEALEEGQISHDSIELSRRLIIRTQVKKFEEIVMSLL